MSSYLLYRRSIKKIGVLGNCLFLSVIWRGPLCLLTKTLSLCPVSSISFSFSLPLSVKWTTRLKHWREHSHFQLLRSQSLPARVNKWSPQQKWLFTSCIRISDSTNFNKLTTLPSLKVRLTPCPPGLINRKGECCFPCLRENSVDPYNCMSTFSSFF